MKLLLENANVSLLASECGRPTGNLEADTLQVLNVLASKGHDPVTRKDVTAVLFDMGALPASSAGPNPAKKWAHVWSTVLTDGKGTGPWDIIGKTISKVCTSEKTGYYNFPTGVKKMEIAPVVEAPKAKKASGGEVSANALPGELTSKWFDAQIRDNALDRKVASLLRKKFPQESYDELLAETRLWFMTWARQGTCDAHIADGKPPTLTILTIWIQGKVVHRLYREGQDALSRHTKGVRTQGEINKRNMLGASDFIVEDALRSDSDAPRPIWSNSDEVSATGDNQIRDFVSAVEEMAPEMEESELSLVRDVVRARRRRAADRYARMFDHLMEGRTKEEAAVLEGCSELRVTHLYQRVRDDLREAPLLLEVALKVLQAVTEEPFSTVQEIDEDVAVPLDDSGNPKFDIDQAIHLLVLRGLVTESRGNSFAPTDAGRAALEADSLV